jgi:hypothetical protein
MDNQTYLKLAAELVGLPIPDEYWAGTILNFERSAALAAQLMDFPLPPEVQLAPVFRA